MYILTLEYDGVTEDVLVLPVLLVVLDAPRVPVRMLSRQHPSLSFRLVYFQHYIYIVVYYESMKRKLKIKPIRECLCTYIFFFVRQEKRSQMQAISLRAAYRALLRISTSVPSEGPEGRNNLAKVRLLAICMYAPTFVSYVIYGPSCQCIV